MDRPKGHLGIASVRSFVPPELTYSSTWKGYEDQQFFSRMLMMTEITQKEWSFFHCKKSALKYILKTLPERSSMLALREIQKNFDHCIEYSRKKEHYILRSLVSLEELGPENWNIPCPLNCYQANIQCFRWEMTDWRERYKFRGATQEVQFLKGA